MIERRVPRFSFTVFVPLPEEEERDNRSANDRAEHENVEDQETAGESEEVCSAANQILWAIDWPHRFSIIVHSNGLPRDEVIEKREEYAAQRGTDEPADAQRRRIVEDVR